VLFHLSFHEGLFGATNRELRIVAGKSPLQRKNVYVKDRKTNRFFVSS
jgi:hypothetical protein